ncbi:alpha/beta fold hydrolase [Nocardia asiatica]|uniref:alpha/beta fold hydrolase n=1 Tax=Nocardia asiatica TaxID=209252 RepID=UPI003EDEFF7C
MSTYLLIHGAFHGGWVWQRVAPLLEDAGHRVLAPSLVGLGDRADLLTADVGLDTHVEDLIDLITAEDLTGIVLAGHSYGGIVITALADALPDRIAELVYIIPSCPVTAKRWPTSCRAWSTPSRPRRRPPATAGGSRRKPSRRATADSTASPRNPTSAGWRPCRRRNR